MTIWRGPVESGQTTGVTAQRLRIKPWHDPRLLIGVLLVLGATILGGRLAAAGDDTVEYWALASSVKPGDQVTRDALVPTRVHLSARAAANYLRTDETLDQPLNDLEWANAGSKGALVERAALVPKATKQRSQLPLNVASGAAPVDLSRGDLVDVWVGPGPGDDAGKAVRVLQSVRVVQTGDKSAAIGGSLAETILVDVDNAQLEGSVVGTVASGHVTLIRVS
jgi:hypothetical protein